MESPCAGSWRSSTRLYTIIRASAGYGWVTSAVRPLPALITIQASSVLLEGVTYISVMLGHLCKCLERMASKRSVAITCTRTHTVTLIRKKKTPLWFSNVWDGVIFHRDSFPHLSSGDRKWRQRTTTTSSSSRGLSRSSSEWASTAGSFLSSSG